MARSPRDDLDLEPEYEQDAGPEEADPALDLTDDSHLPSAQEELEQATESERLNVVSDDEDDLQEQLDAIEEAADPAADRAVDEALEVHDPADYEAAAEATDDESDEAFEEAAAAGDGATVVRGHRRRRGRGAARRRDGRRRGGGRGRPLRGLPLGAARQARQVVRHPLLRRLREAREAEHRAAQDDARPGGRDLRGPGPDGGRGRDQERPAQARQPRPDPRLRAGPHGPQRGVVVAGPAHAGRHRLRRQRAQPDARCASTRRSRC